MVALFNSMKKFSITFTNFPTHIISQPSLNGAIYVVWTRAVMAHCTHAYVKKNTSNFLF